MARPVLAIILGLILVGTPGPLRAQGFRSVGPSGSTFIDLGGGMSVIVAPATGNGFAPVGAHSLPPLQGEIVRTPESQAQIDRMEAHRLVTMRKILAHREQLTSRPRHFGHAARDRLTRMRAYRNGNLITPQGILPAEHPPSHLEETGPSISAFPGSESPDGSSPPLASALPAPTAGPQRTPGGIVGIGGR